MYQFGQEELDAVADVARSRKIFRYFDGGQCERFEKRFGEFLGAPHVRLASSGSAALTAALAGLGIGPGDEVIVPAHTYMATAVSVLAVGAIPVIVDIDESITLSPNALDNAIGPRTRAVIPVHMWGLPCDMNSILEIARRRNLLVIEDACQAVGGGYEGAMLGTLGDAGAYSFNSFKNITCGEGGAAVTSDPEVDGRIACMIDCCLFFWNGKGDESRPFAVSGSRASEFQGAMLNVQLDRLGGMMQSLRAKKKLILRETRDIPGLTAAPLHSPNYECATHILYQLPTQEIAESVAGMLKATICGKTGRHTYTEWDPILAHRAGHVPAMNPFLFAQNAGCRMNYTTEMCRPSLDILNRTIQIANHPDHSDETTAGIIRSIRSAMKTPDGVHV